MNNNLKAITITMIFEASALNRDEKLAGNIPSIKKLTRGKSKTLSYLSRVAMRHYLWETLFNNYQNNNYQNDWKETPCIESGKENQKVVQFDLTQANILNYAELDAFGYMFTIGEQSSITRKAPVGITKAISLETWEGDMQFNANPDLAKRANTNPNPVNKEEHLSFYKVTFTIDVDKLGNDEWWIYKDEYKNSELELILSKPKDMASKNVKSDEKKHTIKNVSKKFDNCYKINNLGMVEIKEENKIKKAIFRLDGKIKKKRLEQILTVLKNGLIYHSSGENYGIVPKFIIAAGLKLPVPLFHSFIELGDFEDSVFENDYILKKDGKNLVFVYNPKNLVKNIPQEKLFTDWKDFLEKVIDMVEENETGSEN